MSASSIEEALVKAIEQSSPAIKIILPKRLRSSEKSVATSPPQREQR